MRIATDTLIDLPGETDYSVIIVARGGENMIITSASQAVAMNFPHWDYLLASFLKSAPLGLSGFEVPSSIPWFDTGRLK